MVFLLQKDNAAEKVVLNESCEILKVTPEMFFPIVISNQIFGKVITEEEGYYKTPSNSFTKTNTWTLKL